VLLVRLSGYDTTPCTYWRPSQRGRMKRGHAGHGGKFGNGIGKATRVWRLAGRRGLGWATGMTQGAPPAFIDGTAVRAELARGGVRSAGDDYHRARLEMPGSRNWPRNAALSPNSEGDGSVSEVAIRHRLR
jgi:hypothetical protein